MSNHLPRLSGGALLAALRRAGWEIKSQSGSHVKLRHPHIPGRIIVPMHGNRTLPIGTLASIVAQAGLTADELKELL